MSAKVPPVLLVLPSEAGVLPVVRAALHAMAESYDEVRLSPSELDEVTVTLQEACTNVIRHAHGHDASIPFRVEFRLLDGGFEIRVRDRGPVFDLAAMKPPNPEELREGGYGISIMRAWMDELELIRHADGNELRLVRRYRAGDPVSEVGRAAGV